MLVCMTLVFLAFGCRRLTLDLGSLCLSGWVNRWEINSLSERKSEFGIWSLQPYIDPPCTKNARVVGADFARCPLQALVAPAPAPEPDLESGLGSTLAGPFDGLELQTRCLGLDGRCRG